DMQADIVAELIRHGVTVHAFNQRSIAEIFDMIRTLGALVGAGAKAAAVCAELSANLERVEAAAAKMQTRPRVYFEEWDVPMISGIAWVCELVRIAGGEDVFADRATQKSAKDRIVTAQEVIDRAPDIIIASWCGKKFNPAMLAARPGFAAIPAVRNGRLHEVKSALILQPGPAALSDGVAALQRIICRDR
ncbi:MAG TPA: ABC transporter substrate-binding protein, partial [Rhizomicrobium sp.]|nr:ABC transporter substrate-binding protein [Rhizomicrobium sp.]